MAPHFKSNLHIKAAISAPQKYSSWTKRALSLLGYTAFGCIIKL